MVDWPVLVWFVLIMVVFYAGAAFGIWLRSREEHNLIDLYLDWMMDLEVENERLRRMVDDG